MLTRHPKLANWLKGLKFILEVLAAIPDASSIKLTKIVSTCVTGSQLILEAIENVLLNQNLLNENDNNQNRLILYIFI